jgi:hypothetical protein
MPTHSLARLCWQKGVQIVKAKITKCTILFVHFAQKYDILAKRIDKTAQILELNQPNVRLILPRHSKFENIELETNSRLGLARENSSCL